MATEIKCHNDTNWQYESLSWLFHPLAHSLRKQDAHYQLHIRQLATACNMYAN